MTQFDGLKVLSKESILQAVKERRDDGSPSAAADTKQDAAECEDEDSSVAKFLSDVSQWLQEQN